MREKIAIIREKEIFGAGYCRLRIEIDENFPVLPGQFAMLKPAGIYEPLLRRAMAFYRAIDQGDHILADFIFHILGRGTQALAQLHNGDAIEFLGPLGQAFSLKPAEETGKALIVAGGVGSPAVLILAEALIAKGIDTTIFLGGRSDQDLIGTNDFNALGMPCFIATDNGSAGEKGFVTQPLERFLQTAPDKNYVIYTCGPDPMMKRVGEIGTKFGVTTYASLEARMACGFGVCVGCVVEIDCGNGLSNYQRVCIEGPVFNTQEIMWE